MSDSRTRNAVLAELVHELAREHEVEKFIDPARERRQWVVVPLRAPIERDHLGTDEQRSAAIRQLGGGRGGGRPRPRLALEPERDDADRVEHVPGGREF